MPTSPPALSPSLRTALAEALRAMPGAELVTLSNLYGLPILRLAAESASSSSSSPSSSSASPSSSSSSSSSSAAVASVAAPAEPIETLFAAAFAVTAEQLEKLARFGRARGAFAVYGEHVVAQFALHPLVLALVAREREADLDAMRAAAARLLVALRPLRDAADALLEAPLVA
jgi:hypothetical protein